MLPNMSDFGLSEFERQFSQFRSDIAARQDMKDIMWKDMLWYYLHSRELQEVTSFISQHPIPLAKTDLLLGKVDLKCVEAFLDVHQHEKLTTFAEFLSKDQGRIELYFKAQFNHFIDKKKLEASESVLH